MSRTALRDAPWPPGGRLQGLGLRACSRPEPPAMRLLILLLPLILCSCMQERSEGLITTYDGNFVVGTAPVVTDDLCHRWAVLARNAAGENWTATITIHGEPVFNLVHVDEFGWPDMRLDLVLVPPTGTTTEAADAGAKLATDELLSVANYRVPMGHLPVVATTVLEPGKLPPGATSYITVEGDTLASIAAAFYGTTQYWRRIADANRNVGVGDLKAGMTLVIPAKP